MSSQVSLNYIGSQIVSNDTNTSNYILNTSNFLQQKINTKQAIITGGGISSITTNDLTTGMVLVSDGSGKVSTHGTVTSNELTFLDGVTSSIQTQINSKEPLFTVLGLSKGGIGTSSISANTLLGATTANTISGLSLGTFLNITNSTLNVSSTSILSLANNYIDLNITNNSYSILKETFDNTIVKYNNNYNITNNSNYLIKNILNFNNNYILQQSDYIDNIYNISYNNIVNVACSQYHTVFLENTGKPLACGVNSTTSGITGTRGINGVVYVPHYVLGTDGTSQMTGIVNIVCSVNHTVFLENTGKVLACGANSTASGITGTQNINGVVYVPQYVLKINTTTLMTGIINITSAQYHTVYLENTGKVLACGFNNGNAGTGLGITGTRANTGAVFIPEYVLRTNTATQMTGIVNIVCSIVHTLFLENTGKVLACGWNNQTTANGNGITGTRATNGPVYIPEYVLKTTDGGTTTSEMTGIVNIACSNAHTVFLENTGKVLACGYNNTLSSGTGITGTRAIAGIVYIPEYVLGIGGLGQMSGIVNMVCSVNHTVFLENTGKVLACGVNSASIGITGTRNTSGIVYIPEYVLGTLGIGTQMTGIVNIVCGNAHTVFLENTGKVLACGLNSAATGITGTRTTNITVYVPEYVLGTGGISTQMTGIANIVCSISHTVFIENTGRVLACGVNSTSLSITGTRTINAVVYVPEYVIYTQNIVKNYLNTGKIKNTINGNNCILAITDTDTVLANYDNTYGKLGTPHPIYNYNDYVTHYTGSGNLTGVTKIACGLYHTVFLLNTNTAYSCGFNIYGQLGTANTITYTIPTAITNGTTISNIACGLYHTVLLSGTTAKSCGLNNYGQLGLNDNNNRSQITDITSLTNISDIDCGEYFTVLKVGTTVYSTGLNDKGQLGVGDITNKIVPTQVLAINNTGGTITNVNLIKCTKNNIIFLMNNNTIAVCGNNVNNIYNDNNIQYYNYPSLIKLISETKTNISAIYTNIYTDEIYIKTS